MRKNLVDMQNECCLFLKHHKNRYNDAHKKFECVKIRSEDVNSTRKRTTALKT